MVQGGHDLQSQQNLLASDRNLDSTLSVACDLHHRSYFSRRVQSHHFTFSQLEIAH